MHVPCYYNFLRGISRIPFRPTNCLSFFSAINLNMCGNRMHFKIHPDNWNVFTSLLQSPREQDSNSELPNVSVSQFSNEYNRKKNKSILKCYFGSNKTFRLALICGTVKLMQMSDFNKPDMELAESHGDDALCTPDCITLQIQGVALVKLAYPLLLNRW